MLCECVVSELDSTQFFLMIHVEVLQRVSVSNHFMDRSMVTYVGLVSRACRCLMVCFYV
jgi:hypothetical protein